MTKFHSKYFAHELTRAGGKGVDRLGRALFDACVDLNPHQIEAALFALRSPLSKGVLLADEVGLGKAGDRLERLTRCREIESKISELRGQLKKAAFTRQVELNTQIKTFEQELKQLVGAL